MSRVPQLAKCIATLGVIALCSLTQALSATLQVEQEFRAEHMILCVAPFSDQLLLGTQSGHVQVWNWRLQTEEPVLLSLESSGEMESIALGYPIRSIALPADESLVAVAASDLKIHIFAGKPRWQPLEPIEGFNPTQLCFINKQHLLIGEMNGDLSLFDLSTGQVIYSRQLEYDPISALALSPDGSKIAVAFTSSKIQVLDAQTGRELSVLKGHKDHVFALLWNQDGSALFSCGKDRRLLRWPLGLAAQAPEEIYRDERYIYALAAHPAGQRLALSLSAEGVGLLEVGKSMVPTAHKKHSAPIAALGFLDDGKRLYSASSDARLIIWRVVE
jgi:WD40 repeat protein